MDDIIKLMSKGRLIMRLKKSLQIILVGALLLLIGPNLIYAEDDSNSLTKWGPKLSEEELVTIASLSTSELVEMLKNGDTLHAYAALKELRAGEGRKANFELLLNVAANTRGDMIVEGLVKPIKPSADAEDKRLVDKYLDFLEAQLKKVKPSVSHQQAIRSIAQTTYIKADIWPAWYSRKPADPNIHDPNELLVPYANDRVVNILMRCLDNSDRRIREVAIRWLANVGANDITQIDSVIAVLNAQVDKELSRKDKEEIKTKMKNRIHSALRQLNKNIDERYFNFHCFPMDGGKGDANSV
jgi:hypothetical protein